MALEKVFKIPSLVRKAGQSASKAQPFYSNVDQAIANITQGTGTGAQMLAELLKTKGVAKELKDRPAIKKTLEANKDAKVTKADLKRLAAENPAPRLEELIKTRNTDNPYQIVPDADGFNIEISGQRLYPDPVTLNEAENAVQSLREEDLARGAMDDTKHSKYTIPGGENYREILLRLPDKTVAGDSRSLDVIAREMFGRRMNDLSPADQFAVRAKTRANESANFTSSHFNEPNILAHARVTDRVGPNGEKILHVEEIQSDWHQAARDARKKEIKRLMEVEGIDKATAIKRVPESFGYAQPETKRLKGVAQPDEHGGYKVVWEDGTFSGGYSKEGAEAKALEGKSNAMSGVVPDAPFKQNWHELVMKRLLDDAARNGYDRVVITPGAEQARRYALSKHIGKIEYEPTDTAGQYEFIAYDKSGKPVIHEDEVPLSRIEELVGQGLAKKIEADQGIKQEGGYRNWREISGLDLDVGGEGMTGFYDQILPSYLNDYGKRYGVQVGTYEMPVGEKMIPDRAGLGMIRSGEQEMAPFHSFDITPQMREDITTKGVPLYQAAPPVAIGAGAMQEEQPAEYAGGGAVRKALKAVLPKGQQAILPAAESAANLEKFLADSAIKDRLYHGTNNDFRKFSDKKLGQNTDTNATSESFAQTARVGHWFNTQPMGKSPEKYGAGYTVDMPVYLSIKNPKREMNLDWLAQGLESKKGRAYRRELEEQGYDGVVLPDEEFGGESWIAFQPTQIKSAIGNRGTYDITDPDINKAKGGRVTNDAMWMAVQNKQLRKKHGN